MEKHMKLSMEIFFKQIEKKWMDLNFFQWAVSVKDGRSRRKCQILKAMTRREVKEAIFKTGDFWYKVDILMNPKQKEWLNSSCIEGDMKFSIQRIN